jgi:hypothetical protein
MIKEVKSPKDDDTTLVNPTPVLDDVFQHDTSIPILGIEDIVVDAANHTIH